METIRELADRTGMKANTIQKILRNFRDKHPGPASVMGIDKDTKIALSLPLSSNLVESLLKSKPKGRKPKTTPAMPAGPELPANGTSNHPPKPKPIKTGPAPAGWIGNLWKSANLKNFGVVMIRLSIFSMGTRASWGVFSFSALLDPLPLAIIEACSLELIYIGLTFAPVDDDGKKNVLWVSASALFVSVLYNVLASAHQQSPGIFENLDSWLFWVMAFLHGSPMAILNFVTLFVIFDHIKKMRK